MHFFLLFLIFGQIVFNLTKSIKADIPYAKIIFLRSHSDDYMRIKKGFYDADPISRDNLANILFKRRSAPIEELVCKSLAHYGNVVSLNAIENNDNLKNVRKEKSSSMGIYDFDRIDSTVLTWQETVLRLLIQARLVVVLLPKQSILVDLDWGVGWELHTIRKIDKPEKVLMLIPPLEETELMSRWNAVRVLGQAINIQFPEIPPKGCCAVLFSKDWVAEFGKQTYGTDTTAIKKCLTTTIIDPNIDEKIFIKFFKRFIFSFFYIIHFNLPIYTHTNNKVIHGALLRSSVFFNRAQCD